MFYESDIITSRKHGKKELQSFSHCKSFDQPDLQSLNDYIYVFFGFTTAILKSEGACNTPLERYCQDLSSSILNAPKFLKFQLVNQKNKSTFV